MNDSPYKALPERFKTLRKVLGKTQKQAGAAIGGGLRTWQNYETGRSAPNWRVLKSLNELGVNVNWLLTGEGRMFFEARSDAPGAVREDAPAYGRPSSSWIKLPLMRSPGADLPTAPIAFDPDLVKRMGEDADALRLYHVTRDAESRHIPTARYVVIDTKRIHLKAGGLYLIRLKSGLNLVRVERDHDETIYLDFDNPYYHDVELTEETINTVDTVGRAVWSDHWL